MDNPIIFQILLALVALFFIFLTYMNTKTWRWVHVTITLFVFIAVIPFGTYAAMTLKTRLFWIGKHDKLAADLAQTTKDVELAIHGEPSDVEGKAETVVNLRGNLARAILDRGRVWRNLTAVPAANTPLGPGFTISMSPPADPAAPAAPAPKHNIDPKTVLFAFLEGPWPADQMTVPLFYMGEFRVSAATDRTITIEPTLPLTGDQAQAGANPNNKWALYEVCPVDGHEWFAGKSKKELTELIPIQATGLTPQAYDTFIQQFLRDGEAADEVKDPPENIWIEVKFDKKYSVTVDAAAVASVDTDPFNAEGQAQLDRLRKAGPGQPAGLAEFEAGQTAIFDKQTAEKLIADGTAKLVRPVYRRTLVDFDVKFQGIFARYAELNDRIRELTLDVAAIKASKDKADQQATLLEDYKSKLNDDVTKVKFELAELTKYAEAVSGRLAEVRAELSQLYRSNKALSAELTALNAQMTKDIERRTTTALNP